MEKTTTHSPIGASAMHRWEHCPASVKLSENIPKRQSSVYAEEGTIAHEYAASVLLGTQLADIQKVTLEMKYAVEVYVRAVRALLTQTTLKEDIYLVERSFDLSKIFPQLYGTADCVIGDSKNQTLYVIDFKYGMGVPVEVAENGKPNSQLMYYGLGALISTGFKAKTIELLIIQPRCPHADGPIRAHTVSIIEMLEFSIYLKEKAKETTLKDAALMAGDWCRWCPASAICPLLSAKAQDLAKIEFKAVKEPLKDLSGWLPWLPILEGWIRSVREYAYEEMMSGKKIEGYKLVEKRCTKKWTKEALREDNEFFIDSYYDKKLKTPAQVLKILAKDQRAEFAKRFIVEVSSGLTLVAEKDKREELTNTVSGFSAIEF